MKFFRKNLYKIIIGILIFVLIFFSISKNRAGKTDKSISIKPTRENIKSEITLAGSIDASSKADLRFQSSGQLAWIGVKIGDRVKKYQAVAGLDKKQLIKNLQTELNDYKTGLSNFNTTQDTYKTQKDNFTLTEEMKRILDRSQYALDNSVINYELSDLAIKYATLISPISGIVTNIEQSTAGINVTPLNMSISIIDPQSIYFKSQIDQEDVIKIKIGDKTTIKLDSFPENLIESKITYISFTPITGQSSTVYEVRFKLSQDNKDLKYRLGMDGNATIFLKESNNALTIPLDAVYESNDQKYVYLKSSDNEQPTKQAIKTGIETDTIVEVLEGISENDQIIIKK